MGFACGNFHMLVTCNLLPVDITPPDALQVAMSGVQMIQENTRTCLANLERSLCRCHAFLKHRCIPKDCVMATAVSPNLSVVLVNL